MDWGVVSMIWSGLMTGGMLYLAFRKAPVENRDLNGNTIHNLGETVSSLSDELRTEKKMRWELEKRLEVVENPQKYAIKITFMTSSPPTVEDVEIAPVEVQA
jgi:hypothetical protein